MTVMLLVTLLSPATLEAVQVYIPESLKVTSVISSVSWPSVANLPAVFNSCPSLYHITCGGGKPLTGQLIVSKVLYSVVTLSPILKSTRVLSVRGIVLLLLGKSMDASIGSVDEQKNTKQKSLAFS